MLNRIPFLTLLILPLLFTESPAAVDSTWHHLNDDGRLTVKLWFFWSENCRHCQDARPVIEKMASQNDWLHLESRELTGSRQNRQLFSEMGKQFGREARSVPAFFFCNTMMVGFASEQSTGKFILQRLNECRTALTTGSPTPIPGKQSIATLQQATGINTDGMSLPVLTLVIAGLDAFNPCAFFVLLFLLSLMIHADGRKRMLLVGSVFVLFSGLIYFLFMAAWLNIFLLVGTLRWVTVAAGLVAVTMGGLNIKDYFIASGPSLSISRKARPGLFERMRKLLDTESLPAMLLGTVLLAIAANSYELLCTTGLPMVYTRLLTLESLPVSSYYFYLIFYNLIYVLPLLLIVVIFASTLGSRKLQAHEGRALKLLSGLMMLALGLLLILDPNLLGNLRITIGVIIASVFVAFLAYRFAKRDSISSH